MGTIIGIGNEIGVRKGANVNQTLDESLLADGIYLTTEEGDLISEQDNKNSFIISED